MNNITVLICSHRTKGTNFKIVELLKTFKELKLDIITFDRLRFKSCVHCLRCGITGRCSNFDNDDFNALLEKIKASKIVVIISPLYALIPSKLAAFLERLISVTYFIEQIGKFEIPLKNKKVGVICYDSECRNTELEVTITKVLKPCLTGYLNEKHSEGLFLENIANEPNKYGNIIEYIGNYFKENFCR